MKLKKVIMALLDKIKQTVDPAPDSLSIQEIEFIQRKLRGATYIGEEFEQFYTVYVKLTKELENLKK